MINSDRIIQRFTMLAQIDSISREEGKIASEIAQILESMGAKIYFDSAGEKVNGDCGNLFAKFEGNVEAKPIFLSGHMDTVEPGRGVKVQFNDGIFTSDGTTILGSDDKSAIAVILEVMDIINENNLPHPPIEVILTVCEEIGLLGAQNIDYSLMDSKFGYIMDSTDTEGIVTKAPCANKINIKVFGSAAHAGAAPENGVDAISVAAHAISNLDLGRVDEETTCNIGTIKGGTATNIVPDFVEINGEARSHDEGKLDQITQKIVNAFEDSASHFKKENGFPKVETLVELDFPKTNIPENHIAIRLARKAAQNLGKKHVGICSATDCF